MDEQKIIDKLFELINCYEGIKRESAITNSGHMDFKRDWQYLGMRMVSLGKEVEKYAERLTDYKREE